MLYINEKTIKRINEGDVKAFEELYTSSYVYLCAVATKYIYNAETAKEIVNDLFMNVWNNRSTLTFPIKAYLIKGVQNRCLNHLRREHPEQLSLNEVTEKLISFREEWITQDAHPIQELESRELQQILSDAINTLPPKCRDIFIEHIFNHKTYEEIAEEMNLSSSTVRGQIRIGLAKLKPLLGDAYFELILISMLGVASRFPS